jgi:hypothetical protein
MPKISIFNCGKEKKIVKENAIFLGMFRNILFLRSLGLTHFPIRSPCPIKNY